MVKYVSRAQDVGRPTAHAERIGRFRWVVTDHCETIVMRMTKKLLIDRSVWSDLGEHARSIGSSATRYEE